MKKMKKFKLGCIWALSASVLLTVPGINVSAQQFVCEPEIISETVADDGETGAGDGETGNQMETVDDTEDNNVPESNTETESGDVLKSSEETRESESIEDTEEGSDIAPLSVDVAVGSTAEENGLIYTVTKVAAESAHGTVAVSDGTQASGNVIIPATVEIEGLKYDVKELGSGAFHGNTQLTGIDLSAASISVIGSACFADCTSLSSVRGSEAIVYTSIKNGAFRNCISLTTVYFNYAQISKSTIPFSGCTSLARVTIMNPVQLGANAFSGLPEGFVLSCPNKLSVSSLDASVFGTTKNPVIEIPDETTKEKVVAKLGTKAEVKMAVRERQNRRRWFRAVTETLPDMNP